MKKISALLIALMMVLCASAMAEGVAISETETETEYQTVTWDMIMQEVEEVQPGLDQMGGFVRLEDIGLQVWIPNGLSQKELEGTLYYFSDEDNSHALTIFCEDAPEGLDVTDKAALVEFLEGNNTDDLAPAFLNGVFCVSYTMGEGDSKQAILTYGTTENKMLHFVIEPFNNEEFDAEAAAVLLIAGSVMACE